MEQMWCLLFMLYSTYKNKLWAIINIFSYVAALFKQKIYAVSGLQVWLQACQTI